MTDGQIQTQRLYKVSWFEGTVEQTSYFYGPSMEDAKAQFTKWYKEVWDKEFVENKGFQIERMQKG